MTGGASVPGPADGSSSQDGAEPDADAISETRILWPRAFRIIRSIHPPIELFEDLADPEDWDALISVEMKTNPRIREEMGRLDLVPPHRRVGGEGASLVMAPFVHVSIDRPGRFTDGSYGIYSAGDSEEVAIRETAYHHGLAMLASREAPGWTSQFRALVNRIDTDLHDLRGRADCHHPSDYAHSQAIGAGLRAVGSNGIIYDSVRCPGGSCAGIFWPDLIEIPVQGDHYDYHWDGMRVDRILNRRTQQIFGL